MINLNLAIRQKDKEEAGSFRLQISNTKDMYGIWHCIVTNNDSPTETFSIHKDSFIELANEIEDYINNLGVIINVHEIDISNEIKEWILQLKNIKINYTDTNKS